MGEQQTREVFDGLAFYLFKRVGVDHRRLRARVPKECPEYRHPFACVSVVRAEGVAERRPVEARHSERSLEGDLPPLRRFWQHR